jgi:hypothetical protein
MVELKVYKFKDKDSYETLKPTLSGWCFFRIDGESYLIKAPNNKFIKDLVGNGILIEII